MCFGYLIETTVSSGMNHLVRLDGQPGNYLFKTVYDLNKDEEKHSANGLDFYGKINDEDGGVNMKTTIELVLCSILLFYCVHFVILSLHVHLIVTTMMYTVCQSPFW